MTSAKAQRLLKKHDGNITAIAHELGVSRQAVQQQLGRLKLLREAEVRRAENNVPGTRATLPNGVADPLEQHRQVLDALADTSSYEDAAKALDISRRTLFHRIKRYSITRAEVEAHRAKQGKTARA